MEYKFKTEPFAHQREIFDRTQDLKAHALLWEQGTGKTKPTIDTAAWLWERGEIDGVLVVAPDGVHRNWATDELPAHLPERVERVSCVHVYRSNKAVTKWHQRRVGNVIRHEGLSWLMISYDAFITPRGKKAVWDFLRRRRVLYILDEAHKIKTPKTKRSRSITASARHAEYRRLLTGTPGDKPFDLYSQLRFVDPNIWHRRDMSSFQAFKNRYGRWFTQSEAKEQLGYDPGYDQLLEYRRLDELRDILAACSDRLLKEDVLDLPPKLYTRRYFSLTPAQRAVYNEMRDKFEAELASGAITDGTMAIVRLLKLQQITCGYCTVEAGEPVEDLPGANPRLEQTVEYLNELGHPAIVWCRFRRDIDLLMGELRGAVRYDGSLDEDEAARSKAQFQGGEAQFFIGNPAKGSEGLTLNAAKTVVYYSNSFKLLERLQSEDRAHRIGQDGAEHGGHGHGVLYTDLTAEDTIDEHISRSLREKFDIAAELTGDQLRNWI